MYIICILIALNYLNSILSRLCSLYIQYTVLYAREMDSVTRWIKNVIIIIILYLQHDHNVIGLAIYNLLNSKITIIKNSHN